MSNEDIMKAIEQVAAQASNDQDRMEKEAYINAMADKLRADVVLDFWLCGTNFPPYIQAWAESHRQRLSIQIGEVARILLRKELLGE